MHFLGRYLLGLMIAINQLTNAITGGDPQTSVSARIAEARDHGHRAAKVLCAMIEKIDFHPPNRPDHCTEAERIHLERMLKGLAHEEALGRAHASADDGDLRSDSPE
jgi:hypothetical protein